MTKEPTCQQRQDTHAVDSVDNICLQVKGRTAPLKSIWEW